MRKDEKSCKILKMPVLLVGKRFMMMMIDDD